jgi:hypothetical protein
MKIKVLLSVVVGLIVCFPARGFAETNPSGKFTLSFTDAYIPSEWVAQEGYLAQAKGKLLFGGKNALLGWLELYNEPRQAVREDQPRAMLRGIGYGLANMVGDTLGGALHLATFPITAVDVALPEGGTDLL